MIAREINRLISDKIFKGKAIVIIGARQVGKTTLVKQIFLNDLNVLWFDADDLTVRTLFENVSVERFRLLFGKHKIIVIDEAQRIENIGIKAKIIIDNFPDIQLILTGSSSFDLVNKINEPLTGRKWEYYLFPLSFGEMVTYHGLLNEIKNIPLRLVYGYYPDVVLHPNEMTEILKQLTNSYLYKDIFIWERIKRPDKLIKLMQALAFQLGNEVSYSELSRLLEIDKATVEKYIQLLEQTHVVFRLSSYSKNLRNELKNKRKIFFYDNGIRNAIINDFSQVENRNDIGALWENFMISERLKCNHYTLNYINSYFWRTTQQQEIDYIEEKNGSITGYEFKWNPKKKSKTSKSFLLSYPKSQVFTITNNDFYSFLGINE